MNHLSHRRHAMRAARGLAVPASLLAALAACGTPTDADPRTGAVGIPGEVASVEVIPDRATIRIGDTTQLAVQLRDFAGGEAIGTVTWRTVGFGAVTVSQTGLIVGVTPGQARVVATSNGKADTAVVDVPHIPIATIDVVAALPMIYEDRSTEVTATPRDAAGAVLRGKHLAWNSSDPSVAVVSSKGVVTGRGPGIVTISAVGEGVTGSVRLILQVFFISVSSGAEHTCGATVSGAILCWGRNDDGQLGDGTTESRNVPVRVKSSETFMGVYAGSSHTCGLTRTHAAHCWGANDAGQLGDGTRISRTTPAPTVGGVWFYGLLMGPAQTCGSNWSPNPALNDGLYCWGDNTNGQFASGTRAPLVVPTRYSPEAKNWLMTFGTKHVCSQSHCWGDNSAGQLGDGTTESRTTPTPIVPVPAPYEFNNVVAGPRTTCATGNGRVWCWGAMFDGSIATFPQYVPSSEIVGSPTVGERHGCVINQSRDVYCWGQNDAGQVGDGTTNYRGQFTRVAGITYEKAVSAGLNHTCALSQAMEVRCWGRNDRGQLGDGTFVSSALPKAVLFR